MVRWLAGCLGLCITVMCDMYIFHLVNRLLGELFYLGLLMRT